MAGNKRRVFAIFVSTLVVVFAIFGLSITKTNAYNAKERETTFSGEDLFPSESTYVRGVSVQAAPRDSTWTKCFDLKNEGITEHNVQAYTYDFTIANNTRDEVDEFTFKLTFNEQVFLSNAWNGSLEIHQNVRGDEIVSVVEDMREFVPSDHPFKTVTFDGENLVPLQPGDYVVYLPSTGANALEVPIKPYEATTPGLILYAMIGENIGNSVLELNYSFNRLITGEPLFWVSVAGFAIWSVALIIYAITSAQIKKYQKQHDRDNKIINESIETFTGFIDAKDPYTNGHSKRVAIYTRLIAKEMGYEGEDLDRIYYVALLHDCGKIGVPDNILSKPGRLTDEEFEVIKSHTVRGGEILSSFKSLKNVGEGALYHHERYDGNGYPEGLAGEDIPLIARMICVADSFDAMNTNRVYRKKLSRERVIEEIETNKGRQFDPKIADIMLGLLRDDKIHVGD